MANGNDEQARRRQETVDRLTANLAQTVDQNMRAVTDRVRTFGEALERFSDRLSSMFPSGGAAPAPAAAAAGASGGSGAPAASGGVMLVRVVNETNSPVPVNVVTQTRQQPGGLAGVLGGIGGFFGGLIGGFVGGLAAPFMLPILAAE